MSLTAQEVFDKVVAHLRKQMAHSEAPVCTGLETTTRCLYRSPQGLACAVGCLITDEEYRPSFDEGAGVQVKHIMDCVPSFRERVGKENEGLLYRLQEVHDCNNPLCWEMEFREVARYYQLTYTAPEAI
jgi:hypothetical protein